MRVAGSQSLSNKALDHMAWSNQIFFENISKLPEEIYAYQVSKTEWQVGKVLTHFVGAAEWYRYCLTGVQWTKLHKVTNHQELLEYKKYLGELDQAIIYEANKEDRVLEIKDESGTFKAKASTILTQVISHTAEHKGQISTILASKGISFSLDDLDVWSYAKANEQI